MYNNFARISKVINFAEKGYYFRKKLFLNRISQQFYAKFYAPQTISFAML
jgi:hypothetical protein